MMMKKDFWSDILIFLDDPKHPEAGFEEIRKGVGGSPRSINNHLKTLFEQGLIKKGWGKRGKFSLTPEGEANAAHQRDLRGIVETAESLPNSMLKKLREYLRESVLQTIAQRLMYLKAVGAPKQVILIGEKMLKEEDVTNAEALRFYGWNIKGTSCAQEFEKYLENEVKKGNRRAKKVLDMWYEIEKG